MRSLSIIAAMVLAYLGVIMFIEGYLVFGIVDVLLSILWLIKATSK